jgi:thiol-disulfide isomerase/thioredoxin
MLVPRVLAAALAFVPLTVLAQGPSDPPGPVSQPGSPAPSPVPKSDPPTGKKPEAAKPAIPPAPRPVVEPTLKVGHKAPDLRPEKWVKTGVPEGVPTISAFESGKVYIVEFWATWCPSCKEALPVLAKLARDHKDLTIVAVASSERKPKKDAPDDRLEGVRRFVKDHEEIMPYAVLFDGARPMASAFLVPAGRIYLPTAFIIDHTGAIAWIGDPRERSFDNAVTTALRSASPAKSTPPSPTPPTTPTREPAKKPAKPGSRN